MKKKTKHNDELRPEYDMKSLLNGGVRGKYAARYRAGTNLVLLEPDVAKAFPNDNAVNEALKLVIKLKQIQEEAGQYSTKNK
ncbi:MAG: hypothetical protein DCC56_13890 [Anaerolineae bacterium]|nr:MAG: hypothetical protein DCC56_13890 [Anaerolineae bacterium]WKZ43281.1 MAG: hypothetical protein QY302_14360 [Anaerolineales bacterium]